MYGKPANVRNVKRTVNYGLRGDKMDTINVRIMKNITNNMYSLTGVYYNKKSIFQSYSKNRLINFINGINRKKGNLRQLELI